MNEQAKQFGFYRGDVLLGHIIPTHEDFPWHYGKFVASADFQSLAHFFETELRLLKETQGGAEWDKAYDLISDVGLRIEPIGPGKIINNP